MEYLRSIYLDVNAVPTPLAVKAKQGDKVCRKLAITLLQDGQPFTPTGVASYQFRVYKMDGNAVVLEGNGTAPPIQLSDGVYTVTLSEQCLAVVGRSPCDFVLIDSSGNVLSTANFYLDIMPMPDIASVIESSTEWQRLMDAIEQAEEFASIIAFRVNNGNFQYTTDGETWVTICAMADVMPSITDAQIDALFE